MKEILRASLGKCGNAAVACLPHLVERIRATQVDDVNRRLGHFGNGDGTVNAFSLGDRRTRQSMILRSGAAVGEKAFDDLVDDDAVLGVHTDQPASLARRGHRAKDRRVVRQKHARIGHKQLERSDALVHQLVHLFLVAVLKIGRDEVKTVIDRRLALGLFVPRIDARGHRLALRLHGKINDRRRPAKRRRPRSGKKIVRRICPAKRQFHMRMRIDPAGNHQLPRRINDNIRLHIERLADSRDGLAVDKNIRVIVVNGGDDAAVFDQCSSLLTPFLCLRNAQPFEAFCRAAFCPLSFTTRVLLVFFYLSDNYLKPRIFGAKSSTLFKKFECESVALILDDTVFAFLAERRIAFLDELTVRERPLLEPRHRMPALVRWKFAINPPFSLNERLIVLSVSTHC